MQASNVRSGQRWVLQVILSQTWLQSMMSLHLLGRTPRRTECKASCPISVGVYEGGGFVYLPDVHFFLLLLPAALRFVLITVPRYQLFQGFGSRISGRVADFRFGFLEPWFQIFDLGLGGLGVCS